MIDHTVFEQHVALNRAAYETLRSTIRRDYTGQYVAIAEGRLIAAAPSYEEALAAVEQLKSRPECYFIFEAQEEPVFDAFTNY